MKKSAKFKKIIGIVNCSSPYLIIHLESKFEETIYAELSSDSFPIHHAKLMMGQELLFDRDDGQNQLARILPFTRQKPEFIAAQLEQPRFKNCQFLISLKKGGCKNCTLFKCTKKNGKICSVVKLYNKK